MATATNTPTATATATNASVAATTTSATATATPTSGLLANLLTDPDAIYAGESLPRPAYVLPFVDPLYHTTVTRIGGDPGTTFSVGGATYR